MDKDLGQSSSCSFSPDPDPEELEPPRLSDSNLTRLLVQAPDPLELSDFVERLSRRREVRSAIGLSVRSGFGERLASSPPLGLGEASW